MSRHIMPTVLVILALSLITGCSSAETIVALPNDPGLLPTDLPAEIIDTPWDDFSVFAAGLIAAEDKTLDSFSDSTIYHLDFTISTDLSTLTGAEQVRYTNREDTALDEVYFRLFPNITGGSTVISNLRVNDNAVAPIYEYSDSSLRVPINPALQPGESVVIEMDFAVTLAQEMAGNYGLFGYFNDVLVLDTFYPTIPVYDQKGWYAGEPAPNGDISYYDASFYIVKVTLPKKYVVVASGSEVSRLEAGVSQTLTFVAGPARDFYLAASEHFSVTSAVVGETTVNSYAFKDQMDGAQHALTIAVNAMESFNNRLGIYPYTEFDIISSPMQALGIEYPGIVGIVIDIYDLGGVSWGIPNEIMMEGTVAHEVGHQWFYNVVGNDQSNHPWLDEAIVQYITGLYYLDTYDQLAQDGWQRSWNDRWDRVNRADIPIGMSAGSYSGQEYGAIIYGRGPLFITALEVEMGSEIFAVFLRDYYQDHKWGTSTASDFHAAAEEHCQCDLSPLFDAWVYDR
ncbi:MAG: M1 family metallopeptidase [Chloroflexi bacterium]|nr:M1 family metallopeptidase [Chloroflexota bacterium]